MLRGSLMLDYLREHYGDIASVAGLMISIVGFLAILSRVKRAEQAARDADERIALFILSTDIDQALRCLAKIETACYDRRWVQALGEVRDLQSHVVRARHERRIAASEIESLGFTQKLMDTLIAYFQRLAKDPKPRNLSNQKMDQLNHIISVFTTIQV